MNRIEIEKLPYWKSSQSSPDTWIDRTIKLIGEFDGEVINQAQGVDFRIGKAAFMIVFKLQGDYFKIVFPVLEPKNKNDLRAAKIQAATILYHDVKARLVSSTILGARSVFFGNLLLKDGKTAAELENPELSINRIMRIESGDVMRHDENYRTQ